MNMKVLRVLILGFVVFVGCRTTGIHPAQLPVGNPGQWIDCQFGDYGISFKYPSNAKLGNDGSWMPGLTVVDGRYKSPLGIGMRPTYSPYLLTGVFYEFSIRFMVIAETAQLNPMYAKRYGWAERPKTDFYPFTYENHKDLLLTAVERLYLGAPIKWAETKPASIDGRSGVCMSGWDTGLKESKYFHEIIAAPIAPNRILLVQAAYFDVPSELKLEEERRVFTNIVDSIRIEK